MNDDQLKKIKNFSVVDLEKDNTFQEINELVEKYYREIYIGESVELWYFLYKIIDKDKNLSKKYETILNKLAWISFASLPYSNIEKLVKNNLILAIKLEFNILNKIKELFSLHFNDIKDLRLILLKNIKENIERIGSVELEISNEDKKFTSTVKNWLIDYDRFSVIEKRKEKLAILEYISSNENIRNLSKPQRKILKSILEVYDFLRFFKKEVDLLNNNELKKNSAHSEITKKIFISKEKDKKVFVPEETGKQKIDNKEEKKSVEKLLEFYKFFEKDLKSINNNIESLEKYQNNPDGLFKKFNEDLQEGNRDSLLSLMVFICQNKLLDKFLKENEKLLAEFKKYLSFKLSDDIIKNIMNKSASPETVSLYLQFLLFKKIKLSPKNAGLFGMHLANIFKTIGQDKYFPIVYGDVNLEQFVWREVVEENGLVKFK